LLSGLFVARQQEHGKQISFVRAARPALAYDPVNGFVEARQRGLRFSLGQPKRNPELPHRVRLGSHNIAADSFSLARHFDIEQCPAHNAQRQPHHGRDNIQAFTGAPRIRKSGSVFLHDIRVPGHALVRQRRCHQPAALPVKIALACQQAVSEYRTGHNAQYRPFHEVFSPLNENFGYQLRRVDQNYTDAAEAIPPDARGLRAQTFDQAQPIGE
jgi:hypothetical protein